MKALRSAYWIGVLFVVSLQTYRLLFCFYLALETYLFYWLKGWVQEIQILLVDGLA